MIGKVKHLFHGNVDKQAVVNLLQVLLPNFQHIETGLNLDQKM